MLKQAKSGKDRILEEVAKEHLRLDNLDPYTIPFVDGLTVYQIKKALEAAYEAGRRGAATNRLKPKELTFREF